MKIRQVILNGGLAAVLLAGLQLQAFADESANAGTDAAVTSTPTAAQTKKAARAANRTFSRSIQRTLSRTKGLQGQAITVFGNAATGQVTLAGQVQTEDEDHLAVESARKIRGVKSVKSELMLREKGGA
ncbi:BON domain-containing protein [Burkholderia ambifaria]|uniref:BON domain-containing protein n=1 Tax=Burkholderia ambifaria TaxID=152480 RepID=A0AA41EBX8_9BURK|nr:BON domain-containing protein [Burkholderia ambifaria]MBR8132210.1 BON domain-containing protein [Burkholderia ambifaria]PRD97058.1 transporter [Burkholderia ambifaria]